jgi:hypothetical protein
LLWACPKAPLDEPVKKVKVKYNIFGITEPDSSKAYIELFYTKLDASGNNIVHHEWVKPPYEFGDHLVNIEVQKIYMKGHSDLFKYNIFKKYGEGEACYVKIINYSNKPIEYFIAGTQKLHIGDCKFRNLSKQQGCDCALGITYHPRPIYKNAPIYYLLHPEKKTNVSNLQVIVGYKDEEYLCSETGISFKGNTVGNIQLNSPFSIEDAMKIYRAEYNSSTDTIMYWEYAFKYQGLRLSNSSSIQDRNSNYSNIYYEKILPGGIFKSSKKNPVLNLLEDVDQNDIVTLSGNMEPEQW